MRRILFRWRGVTVWSYPAMLYVGLVAGVVAGNVAAHVVGIDAFRAYVATLVLIRTRDSRAHVEMAQADAAPVEAMISRKPDSTSASESSAGR